jgi:hypothetical protein
VTQVETSTPTCRNDNSVGNDLLDAQQRHLVGFTPRRDPGRGMHWTSEAVEKGTPWNDSYSPKSWVGVSLSVPKGERRVVVCPPTPGAPPEGDAKQAHPRPD